MTANQGQQANSRSKGIDISKAKYRGDKSPVRLVPASRVVKARKAVARREWVKSAIQSVASGEKLGDAIKRLSAQSSSKRLRQYLVEWLGECGCNRESAVARINAE